MVVTYPLKDISQSTSVNLSKDMAVLKLQREVLGTLAYFAKLLFQMLCVALMNTEHLITVLYQVLVRSIKQNNRAE